MLLSTAPVRHPPGFIAPCLPTNGQTVPTGSQWVYEIKRGGFVCGATADGVLAAGHMPICGVALCGPNGQIEAANSPFCRSSYATGAVMMRRAITLVLSCTALSGCGALPSMPSLSLPSFNMPSFSVHGAPAGTPVHVTSVPPGAKASFGRDDQSCTTPCTLIATNGTGTFNVSFTLKGYQPQSVPVRIAMNELSSVQSGDSGSAPSTVITPDPVMAELAPFAPGAMKPPAARTKTKPAKTTAATSAPPPASSPPPVSTTAATSGPPPPSSPPPPPVTTAETSAPPSASSPPPATTTAATSASPPDLSPPPAVMTTAATSAPPPASSPQPPATTTVETSSPPSADSLARNGKPGVWDTVSRWWNGR